MFPQNEGPVDRLIRLLLGVVLIPVGLFVLGGVDAGVAGIVAAAIGFIGLVTGLTGFCPTYTLFGFSTARKTAEPIGELPQREKALR